MVHLFPQLCSTPVYEETTICFAVDGHLECLQFEVIEITLPFLLLAFLPSSS